MNLGYQLIISPYNHYITNQLLILGQEFLKHPKTNIVHRFPLTPTAATEASGKIRPSALAESPVHNGQSW